MSVTKLQPTAPTFSVKPLTWTFYGTICEWWREAGESPPAPSAVPISTSFLLEINNVPAAAVSLLFFQGAAHTALVEHLIGNPTADPDLRRQGIRHLLTFLEGFARERGVQSLTCVMDNSKSKLIKRYEDLGFMVMSSNVSVLARDLRK